MYDAQSIISNIQDLCDIKGITINRALTESGAGGSLISTLRKGSMPSIIKFGLLAEYLEIPIDIIVGTVIEEDAKKELSQFNEAAQKFKTILVKKGFFKEGYSDDEDISFFDYLESSIEAYIKLRKQ